MALEALDRAVNERAIRHDTGIVDQVAGGKIVGAINDHIAGTNQLKGVFTSKALLDGVHLDERIQRRQPLRSNRRLGIADVFLGIKHLALQIAGLDPVRVHDHHAPDAGCGKIEQCRTAKAARTYHQRFSPFQSFLRGQAEPGQGQLALIAAQLLDCQHAGASRSLRCTTWPS